MNGGSMNTVALAPRRELEKAAADARVLMAELMTALDARDLPRTVRASEMAYLAVGTLYALARAAESH